MADLSDEESVPTPAEVKRVTKALQDAVKQFYADNEERDKLTVRNVRARAEESLGLDTDFLKSHTFWREKSKALIQAAVVRLSKLFAASCRANSLSRINKNN